MQKAIRYLEAWKRTIDSKTPNALEEVLHESFQMHSPRTRSSSTKGEHINWCITENIKTISDFKPIFENDTVMVGTHTATFEKEVWLVMYVGREQDGKLVEWTINGGPLEEN